MKTKNQKIAEAIAAPNGTVIRVESQHSGNWGPWYHACNYIKRPGDKWAYVPHSAGGHGRRDENTPTIAEIRAAARNVKRETATA